MCLYCGANRQVLRCFRFQIKDMWVLVTDIWRVAQIQTCATHCAPLVNLKEFLLLFSSNCIKVPFNFDTSITELH